MDTDKSKKFMSLEFCKECGSRMSVTQDCEHLAAFHPQLVTTVKEISEKVKNFPHIKQIYPSVDCRNLCAAKVIANRLIENLTRYDRSSVDLIQELSEIITNVSDINLNSDNQENCNLCGLLFKSTKCTITHLTRRHPECLALIQFLRCRPLSELNFQKDIVLLSKTKTQELMMLITNSSVLASHQPFLRLEKLPSHVYQECITKGYATIKENTSTPSLINTQPSPHLNAISAEVMQKIRKTVENSPFPNKSNITVVLVPKKILETSQENSNSERHLALCKKGVKNAILPTSKIIRYGVEDFKRDQLRRQQEKEKITKKEKILKKMLSKYHEKETKKEVLYWQKTLTRYVMQHRKLLFKLESNLINARKWVTSKLFGEQLLEKLNVYVTDVKVVKDVTYLLKKLFDAMEKVSVIKKSPEKDLVQKAAKDKLNSEKDGSIEEFDESILEVAQKNCISQAKNEVPVHKSRQNLSSNLHLTLEENINELPLQGMPKVFVSEVGNDKVLVQKITKEKDSPEKEFNEPILQVAKKNSIYKTKKQVPVQKNGKNLSSNGHLTSKEDSFEDDISELPLQDIPKYFTSEIVNNKALEQKSTKQKLISQKNSSEEVEAIVHDVLNQSTSIARTKIPVQKRLKMSKKPWSSDEGNFYDEFAKLIIPKYSAPVLENNNVLVQKIKNKLISGKNSSKEAILQDFPNHSSNAKNKSPVRKRLKMSKKPWSSEEDNFEDEYSKPIIPIYSAPVKENNKVPEQKRKLISGKNSSKEAILQDVPNHSTSNAKKMSKKPWSSEEDNEDEYPKPIIPIYSAPVQENNKVPKQKRKLISGKNSSKEAILQDVENRSTSNAKTKAPVRKMSKKPWSSEENFEDEYSKPIIPIYSAPVQENNKVPEQKRKKKLTLGKSSLEEATLLDVPNQSTSNARNKAPVQKLRLKMSTLPWTSDEDSFEYDKPIIPRYSAPGPEHYKAPVQKRKNRRVVLSSEVDSSEEEVDAILFQLLQKFYTFKPRNKVPVQKSGQKMSSSQHLTSEKGNFVKEIDKPQKYSPSKVTKLVPVQRHAKQELSNLHLTSEKVDKPPLRGFQKCSSPNVGNVKKLSISSFPAKKSPAAFSSTSICKLGSGTAEKCSSPKVGNVKKLSISSFPVKKSPAAFSSTSVSKLGSGTADPFVNTTLITDDKQFFECYCGKLNCDSLHPENFYL